MLIVTGNRAIIRLSRAVLLAAAILACGALLAQGASFGAIAPTAIATPDITSALELIAPRLMPPMPGDGPAGRSKARAGVVRRGSTAARSVILTFDDGPHPAYTPQILAILKKYNVRATFFVVGKMAAQYPELLRAIAADGHVIGNHTYDHIRLTKVSERSDYMEWQRCSDTIEMITGRRPLYCRPPGLRFNSHVIQAATELGLTVVGYSVNTFDCIDLNKNTVAARVVRDARSGAIVLCHDGFQQTIDALPRIINGLRRKGYVFRTVEDIPRSHKPL